MKRLLPISVFFTISLTGLFAQPYYRTFVASTGSDTATCGQRTTPCASFQFAINHTALAGEVDAVDSGDFGVFNITQSITVDGGSGGAWVTRNNIVTSCGTAGVCIPSGAQVVLRNLSVNIAFYGPFLENGIEIEDSTGVVSIENVQVWAPTGYCVSTKGQLFLRDSRLKNCGTAGVGVQTTGPVALENVSIVSSVVGVGVYQNTGVGNVTLHNCNVSQNSTGIQVIGAATVTADSTMISQNTNGIQVAGGGSFQMSNVTVTGSNVGLASTINGTPGLGTIISFVNNRIYGNTTNGAPTSSVYQK